MGGGFLCEPLDEVFLSSGGLGVSICGVLVVEIGFFIVGGVAGLAGGTGFVTDGLPAGGAGFVGGTGGFILPFDNPGRAGGGGGGPLGALGFLLILGEFCFSAIINLQVRIINHAKP